MSGRILSTVHRPDIGTPCGPVIALLAAALIVPLPDRYPVALGRLAASLPGRTDGQC